MTCARSSCRPSSARSTCHPPGRAGRRARHPVPAQEVRAGRRHPLPARRRLHRHLAPDVRLLHRPAVPGDRLRRFVADYRLAPSSPTRPGTRTPRPSTTPCATSACPRSGSSWAATRAGAGWPTDAALVPGPPQDIHPAGLILFSPEVDLRLDEPSVTENAKLDILPWNIPTASYLHGQDASSASISPLAANLDGFPPTFVAWGGDEMFRDPIRRYARASRRPACRPMPTSSRACSTSSRSSCPGPRRAG